MTIRCVLAVIGVCVLPAGVFAQDDRGPVVSGSVSATNMASHTDVSFGGTFGYRFSRVFGMEIEATAVPNLEASVSSDLPIILSTASVSSTGVLPVIYPGPVVDNPGGRLVIFTSNARVEIPTVSTRVTPYFVAGGGIASTRRTADVVYTLPIPIPLPAGQVLTPSPPRTLRYPVISSSTDVALTLGGGVDVRAMKRLSIEVDLRLFRLLGYDDTNVGRFGVGVRYRF
jgi:opacity protein-like surface antigen